MKAGGTWWRAVPGRGVWFLVRLRGLGCGKMAGRGWRRGGSAGAIPCPFVAGEVDGCGAVSGGSVLFESLDCNARFIHGNSLTGRVEDFQVAGGLARALGEDGRERIENLGRCASLTGLWIFQQTSNPRLRGSGALSLGSGCVALTGLKTGVSGAGVLGTELPVGGWFDFLAEAVGAPWTFSFAPGVSSRVETQTEPSCPKMRRGGENFAEVEALMGVLMDRELARMAAAGIEDPRIDSVSRAGRDRCVVAGCWRGCDGSPGRTVVEAVDLAIRRHEVRAELRDGWRLRADRRKFSEGPQTGGLEGGGR